MIFVGIDCGLDGALVALQNGVINFHDTPTLATGKGARRTYDIPAMVKILDDLQQSTVGEIAVALETQQAMPGQGVTSMFSTGFGFGVWQGLLGALKIRYELVHPLRWKKAMMPNAPKEKEASVIVASRLFPAETPHLKTARGRQLHGRADALLMAEFLRRTWVNVS